MSVIEDTQSKPLPPLENIYFLMVKVIGAKDLDRADIGSKSDPFCKVIANKQSWQTKHIDDNQDPKWDEQTQFCFFDKVDEIEFKVFDWDKGSKHDEIGACKLDTSSFYGADSNGFSGSIDLFIKKKKKGCIDVVVTGRMIQPKVLEDRCVTLEAQSKKQKTEIQEKEEQCQKLMQQNGDLKLKKEKLLKDQQDLNNQCNDLRQQIAEQKRLNQQKSSQIDTLKAKKEKLNKNINEQQTKLDKKTRELKQEKEKLDAANQEYETAKNEVEQARDDADQGYTLNDNDNNYSKSTKSGLKQPLL